MTVTINLLSFAQQWEIFKKSNLHWWVRELAPGPVLLHLENLTQVSDYLLEMSDDRNVILAFLPLPLQGTSNIQQRTWLWRNLRGIIRKSLFIYYLFSDLVWGWEAKWGEKQIVVACRSSLVNWAINRFIKCTLEHWMAMTQNTIGGKTYEWG